MSTGHGAPADILLSAIAEHAKDGPMQQLLRLAVGRETLVIPIEVVREILEVGRMTPLPQTPPFVRGVMNLRGAVVPVVDLGARFGLGITELGRRTAIIVVEAKGDDDYDRLIAGVLVDAVYEVLEVDSKRIEPAPSLGVAISPEFLAGMVNVRGSYAALLNLDQVLSPAALSALMAAPQPA
ncbi:chemotaxis protein CheW [Paucibacter sp. KBW04]|uniref:chemotaxis protein CheW n=1 Tax=Paucibacter sp. KBW04 TaxID=2153361 RepID=UPI000F571CDA|nr:chemotaxis protein CheW [Paucibacter sp. KBW04]RQO62607.1 chemotaxis protein CheW [Paucibacter sp. KBW04]